MNVTGLESVLRGLDAIHQKIVDAGAEVLDKTGEFAVKEAQKRARVDTGNMRDNIFSSREDMTVTVESPVEYSIHNEFDTVRGPGQPFMVPAGELGSDYLLENMTERMQKL